MIIETAMLLLCLKVFFCRILDVSLGTVRMIVLVRGKTFFAAFVGFLEVLIWFLVVREALNSSESGIILGVVYAAGFACGTLVGGLLANRFVSSKISLQVVTSKRDDEMINTIRHAGFAASVVNVNGSEYSDEKYMLFMEIDSRKKNTLRKLVQSLDEHAYITIQETKYVYNGFFKK